MAALGHPRGARPHPVAASRTRDRHGIARALPSTEAVAGWHRCPHLRPALPHLRPHLLRRTFASVLYALDETPPIVMAEIGHTSGARAAHLRTRSALPSTSWCVPRASGREGPSRGARRW